MASFPIARSRRTTVSVAVFVALVVLILGGVVVAAPLPVRWLVGLAVLLPLGILLGTARGAFVTRVHVDDRELRVRGDLYAHDVARADLRVEAARRVDLRGADAGLAPSLRTMGTGLPGYLAGWFTLVDGRDAYVVLTDWSKAVAVPTLGDLLLLSPDDPDALLAALGAQADPVPLESVAPVTPSRRRRWLLVAVAVLTVVFLPVLGITLAAPWRATVDVTPAGDLVLSGDVWGRTIGAADIDASGVRVVDLAGADAGLAPALRTSGTSLPSWSAGWFRRADGGSAFLWVRPGQPVVLVPTRGDYLVLVSAGEADALVAALRR